ncbi:lantibiotic dehydratase [Actinomadura sp. ATCC 31491]|uniref:Lantibiotic dehydratase n=1 Tax=Actinomadura luzonensis TaxID=2805427 RepID=A0ABT0FW13_9ACTN|nr:lantibiotic dehydratase [Actinomadura luzonensis]MCK2216531.1 lantibiotic dehydratase [Actinomadura luzonensis]
MRTNRLLAARLGAGCFELAEALRAAGDLEVRPGDRIAELVRAAPPGADVLDLAGVFGEPVPPALPGALRGRRHGRRAVAGGVRGAARRWSSPPCTTRPASPHGAAARPRRRRARRRAGRRRRPRARRPHRAQRRLARADGLPALELPGPVLEHGGAAADPRRHRLGLGDLYVHSDGRRAVLRAKESGEPLLLHNGELGSALHTALALPRIRPPALPDLPHLPRLTWGNVVLARRRWRLARGASEALRHAGGDRDLLLAMARLREAHGLPRTFFAAAAPAAGAGERRSLYVDTRAPALVSELAALSAAADGLTLTETLPGPGDCWLREGGLRFAAQLRCVYLRPAGRPDTGPCPYPWTEERG